MKTNRLKVFRSFDPLNANDVHTCHDVAAFAYSDCTASHRQS